MFLNQPIKKAAEKKTHRQLKIRGKQLLSEYTSLPRLPRSPFSSLPQHIDPSVRQSDDLTLEGQVLKPRGLDHDGKSWTPKRDFDSAMSWNDASWSQPLFISTCQSLQFFEEKIVGAWLKCTIVSKNSLNPPTRRHKQIYVNSNTSLEVSWNELKSLILGRLSIPYRIF